MKFESGVIIVILLAGLSIIPSYGFFGGDIMPSADVQQQSTAAGERSFTGSAAGGTQPAKQAPDCRSCAKTAPAIPLP